MKVKNLYIGEIWEIKSSRLLPSSGFLSFNIRYYSMYYGQTIIYTKDKKKAKSINDGKIYQIRCKGSIGTKYIDNLDFERIIKRKIKQLLKKI